jgi:hypothetical protein
MIFAVSELTNALATLPLEVDGSGIEEDKIKAGEEIPVLMKHPLFNEVFGAPWGKRACTPLVFNFLTQKSHGPIHMVQGYRLYTGDSIVSPPMITGAIGTRNKQPVQHSQKDCTFHIELKFPTLQQLMDDPRNTEILPESFENQSRADFNGSGIDITFSGDDQQRFLGKSCQGANKCFDTTFGFDLIKAPESSDDALPYFPFDLSIFNKLEVLVTA